MNIFVYSDESGVFDKKHNKYCVFGGAVFLSKEDRDAWSRKYIAAEKIIRKSEEKSKNAELKAAKITNKSKSKLYRSLNQVEKFGIVINQENLHDEIFSSKKGKQRYLDWAYKMAVKNKFKELISKNFINPNEVENVYFFIDEHTTATNGRYELRESMEQEFKYGTFNFNYMIHYKPIFPNLKIIDVVYCNSENKTLIRAADIICNHIYFIANSTDQKIPLSNHLHISYHPNSN